MRAVAEYRDRARECRELARMVHKLEDKYALACAAQAGKDLLTVANAIPSRKAKLRRG